MRVLPMAASQLEPQIGHQKRNDILLESLSAHPNPEDLITKISRLDRIVMPLLMLAFGALQYDRGNMYPTQTPPVILSQADKESSGNALTDFFFRDVGIKQNQFNVGQQLLSTGIVLLEVSAENLVPRQK